jgi:homoserine kinase
MFRARLMRLESAEYALLFADMETNTGDGREIAAAYLNKAAALDKLQKAEVHLRRAYNRTWDRLERIFKDNLPQMQRRQVKVHRRVRCAR